MKKSNSTASNINYTIGIDLGDVQSRVHVIDQQGARVDSLDVDTDADSLLEVLGRYGDPAKVTIAMEVGTHSPWLSQFLIERGFDVLVGNARKLRAIWDSPHKSDVRDAELLARMARFDRQLLSPIEHRGRRSQMDLAILKARNALVSSRTALINSARGLVKSSGSRLPSCSAEAFAKKVASEIPPELKPALSKVIDTIAHLTKQIRDYDRQIEHLCKERYAAETEALRQITGVGALTSLGFILTLESPDRFSKSRDVGPFLGLVPKRDQSGASDKPLSITKAGDMYLRRLLVGSANYILGPFGPDCDLRRHGERIASRGGKVARRKAKTAVARKLSIRLHHLWKTRETYYPIMKDRKDVAEAA